MKRKALCRLCLLCFVLLIAPLGMQAEGDDVLARTIQLKKQRGTIYSLLEEVSDRSGLLFIYDSRLFNNERPVRLARKLYTIRQAIETITGIEQLQMQVMGKHILLSLPLSAALIPPPSTPPVAQVDSLFTVQGVVRDNYTREPIPYSSVGVQHSSIGTVTNQNGEFRLRLPDSLRQADILFSHVGYEPKSVNSSLLLSSLHYTLTLEPKVIPIQEVVVRLVNPFKQVQAMLDSRRSNYTQAPVYHTTFYREGVEYKRRLVNLTEAIFKVYKSPFDAYPNTDQVKLLKLRRISNNEATDSLVTRIKSGIEACLLLDVVKHTPDFLSPNKELLYHFAHTDLTVIDDRLANVISFEQKSELTAPLYKGELYIDAENHALLRAHFEYSPRHIQKAGALFVTKKSRGLAIIPQRVSYTVSYKPWNGTYYISHVRGDLFFKIKKKRVLFNTSILHTWFEMATCKTDTLHVNRFSKGETLPTRTVFAETDFGYDGTFWDNFNVILPEEQLQEAIGKISLKIEETVQ